MPNELSIDTLNERFAIPDVARITAGQGGLPRIEITTPLAAAEVYLHGAQVTSWQLPGMEDALFLSSVSRWQDGSAIRGGVPICFPWFRAKADDPHAPAHGFVRTKSWKLVTLRREGDLIVIVLQTENDEATRKLWPHDFRLEHSITIGSTLKLALTVTNTGNAPFIFQEALHSYFNVGDVEQTKVNGLDGVDYLDNTDGNSRHTQHGDIAMQRQTDSAYLATQGAAELVDLVLHRRIRTEKTGSRTTVVWNPWQNGAAALSDLGNDEWRRMACVEASNILDEAIEVKAGEQHTMIAHISVAPE